MGNLIRSKKEFLVNVITGTEFSLSYSAKTGKIYFHDRVNGVVIEGRQMNTAILDDQNSNKTIKTTVPTLSLAIDKAAVGKTQAGTKHKVTLTPTASAYAAGKLVNVFVISVPDFAGPATPANVIPISKAYQVNTDDISTLNAANLCIALADQINDDPDAIVTASQSSGKLVLEAKSAKYLFNVSAAVVSNTTQWASSVIGFSVAVTTQGKKPVLTYEQLMKEFSIKSWDDGTIKDLPVNKDYVKVMLKYTIDNHYETVSSNGLIKVYDEVVYYIPKEEYDKDVFAIKIMDLNNQNSAYDATKDWHLDEVALSSGGLTLAKLFEIAFAKNGTMAP